MPRRHLFYRIFVMGLWILWVQMTGSALAVEKISTAFIHANLIPMTIAAVLADRTVVVEGKQITAAGPSSQTEVPPNAVVVNCRNAFLMPGLADMHMHLRYDWLSDVWPVSPFQVGLDRVLAEGLDEIAHIEEFLWEFSDLDRQRYFESEGEWMAYAIQATFSRFTPFLERNPQEQEQRVDILVAALLDKLKERPVPVCTTMGIDDLIVQKLSDPDLFLKRPENRYLPASYLEQFRKGREKHQLQFKGGEVFAPFKYMLDKKLLVALHSIDIPLLLSTDAGTGGMGIVPGFSIHDELSILVENGFTPYEALAAGTVVASKIVKRMNGLDEFGTIVPGKRADLILLEQNPLDDVANARKIRGVMAAGRWNDKKAIAEMLDH